VHFLPPSNTNPLSLDASILFYFLQYLAKRKIGLFCEEEEKEEEEKDDESIRGEEKKGS